MKQRSLALLFALVQIICGALVASCARTPEKPDWSGPSDDRTTRQRSGSTVLKSPSGVPEQMAAPRPDGDGVPAPVFLLTGYGPFADIRENESWQVAERMDGEVIAGMRIVSVELPVVWDVAAAKLKEAVRRHRPAAAISMGVGWSGWIEVETVARNRRVNRKDCLGRRPELLVVEQGGPSTILTRLPVERIVKRIREMGIAVRTSDDARGYLCNDAFYAILRATEELAEGPPVPAGFIHLPRARPDPTIRITASERAVSAVDLDGLVRAIRAAIEETAAACSALRSGALHGTQNALDSLGPGEL